MTKEDRVVWLSDISKKDTDIAGGKGANLGEMHSMKLPVPQAFVVTTNAFHYFLEKTGLEERIKSLLAKISVDDTDDLSKKAKQIRQIIEEAELPEDLQEEIKEAYDHFNVDLKALKDAPDAMAIMKSAREPVFVSVRSSATAEDLAGASFAGQQDTFINIKGNDDLLEKIKKVFSSIFTPRSIYYRKKKGFESFVGIAAIVQRMVNSDKSGVMFSKNPTQEDEHVLIEAVFGQGEGIVSGKIKPDQYIVNHDLEIVSEKIAYKKLAIVRDAGGRTKSVKLSEDKGKQRVLKTYEIKQLAEYALKLEEHYKAPKDIEFAIENEDIYILQTRAITTLKDKREVEDIEGEELLEGQAASPGIGSGPV
ncbi:MAG: PEP/pyruvate-binding domain-containing protein, partial [Candidatus Nanoarchaeia archaeon]